MHVFKNYDYSFFMFFKRNEFNHIAILKDNFFNSTSNAAIRTNHHIVIKKGKKVTKIHALKFCHKLTFRR